MEESNNEDLEMEVKEGKQADLIIKRVSVEEDEDDKHNKDESKKLPEDQNNEDHNKIESDKKLQDDNHKFDEDGFSFDNGNSTSKQKIRKSKKKALLRKTTSCLDLEDSLKVATRKRRNDMTLAEKVRLLEMMDANKSSQGKIASHFNISQSQVSRIRTKRAKIMEDWCKLKNPARKRSRFGNAKNVEYKLLDWYEKVTKKDNRIAISGQIIKEKARMIAQEQGVDFKPTEGWLGRWKERNGITLKRFNNKDGSFSVRKLGNHWKRYFFVRATKDISPNDIWVVDQVSFLYNLLPDFLNLQHHSPPEKMIACMAFNLTGTERRDPLLIGNSQCISSFPLPLTYQHSSEESISKEHFAQWLRNWDRSLRTQKRKIILLMYKSAHHPDNLHLFNISINFFPPETESILQPFQFGITETFISLYRYQLVKHLLAMEKTQTSNARHIQVSALDAVYMVWRSWKHISPDTLIKGVVKAGLSKETQSLSTSDWVAPPPGVTQEDFDQFARINGANTEEISVISQLNRDYSEEHSSSQRSDGTIKVERNILQIQDPIKSHQYQSNINTCNEPLTSLGLQKKEHNKSNHKMSDVNTTTESLPTVSEALVACQIIRKYLQKKGGHLHNEFSVVESAIENDMIIEGSPDVLKDVAPDQLFDSRSVHSLISQKEKVEMIISEQQKSQEISQSSGIRLLNSNLDQHSQPVLELTVNENNQQSQEMHHQHQGEESRLEFGSEFKQVPSIKYPNVNQHSSKIQVRIDPSYQKYGTMIKDNCSVPTFTRSTVLTDGRSADIHSTEQTNEASGHQTSPSIAHGDHLRVVKLTESPVAMRQTAVAPNQRQNSVHNNNKNHT